METRAEERFKTALQLLAILGLLLICGVILHKAYVDVAALAAQHSGAGFWRALARYLLRNLAG
jgi:hypothetical protein